MYTTQNVGPFAHIDVDAPKFDIAPGTPVYGFTDHDVFPKIPTTSPQVGTYTMLFGGQQLDITAGRNVAIGIPFDGTPLGRTTVTTFEVSGSVNYAGNGGMNIECFVGRADSATLSLDLESLVNRCSQPACLPLQSVSHVGETDASHAGCGSVQVTVPIGQFNGTTNPLRPIIFGWRLSNPTGGTPGGTPKTDVWGHLTVTKHRVPINTNWVSGNSI